MAEEWRQNLTREAFSRFLDRVGFRETFWGAHYSRYLATLDAVARVTFDGLAEARGLELGTSWVFPTYLLEIGLFQEFDVTSFSDAKQKMTTTSSPLRGENRSFRTFNVDLESDRIPVEDGRYDLILCFELLEHLDVDPMFMIAEINRCLRPGGALVLSTPNSISSQLVRRILEGYSPQFYMYYQKDRSPFRHNFEYAPHQLRQLMEAGGFSIAALWTEDTFAEPDVEMLQLLESLQKPTHERGDNMFVVAYKSSDVVDRYPDQIYDTHF